MWAGLTGCLLQTNARLADQLQLDMWTQETKEGSTIQTAADYILSLDPGDEDVLTATPLISAVGSVYGDPDGKYAAFLQRVQANYKSKTFTFYDDPAAFLTAPGSNTTQTLHSRPYAKSVAQLDMLLDFRS